MRTLSARERKLVAVALLLLVVGLGWLAIVSPIIDGFVDRAGRRAELRDAYVRNSRLINAIPALRRRAEQEQAAAGRYLLRASTPAAARAALADRLGKSFAASGGQVTAVQDLPPQNGRLRAWVSGRTTLAGLHDTLRQLSASAPYLVIHSLRVSADRALESGHLEPMDVRIEASVAYLAAAA